MEHLKLFWQYPVITEKQFFNQNGKDPQYMGIPWATIIDKRYHPMVIYKYLSTEFKDSGYYTCCQHISFRLLIPLFKMLNITKIYACHKIKGEDVIDGIQIMPCPLYAVNYEDTSRNSVFKNSGFIVRDLLYSFVGGYQKQYISDIRPRIFKLKPTEKSIIQHTGQWHFNSIVYSSTNQNASGNQSISCKEKNNTVNYNTILLRSRFSLCPSGSGPNSIRFWESLAVGSIPVLLSNTLELPKHTLWNDSIIHLDESEIENLENILGNITPSREYEMRQNCLHLYKHFSSNYKND